MQPPDRVFETPDVEQPFSVRHNEHLSQKNSFKSAMSNPNGLLSQKVCQHLDQGRTLNDILLRAAH